MLQFLVLAVLFFAVWAGLSQIDYVKRLNLQNVSKRTEKKIGDAIMKTLERTNKKVGADTVQQVLDR